MFLKNKKSSLNLMDLKLRPAVKWETGASNQIVLLVPRFSSQVLTQIFTPRRPNFQVKLDEIGSFLFSQCNGTRTVYEICSLLKEKFGERAEPVNERAATFFQKLIREKLVTYEGS